MKKKLRYLYQKIPLKKELFQLIKLISQPSQSIYQHLYFNGLFEVKINKEKKFKLEHFGAKVENEIFWNGLYGNWEKETLKLWSSLCSINDVIIDVGSNTGIYSLVAKTMNENAKVYAFEPVQRVFERLSKNININSFDIKPFQMGLSDYNGDAVIYDPGGEHLYSVTINRNIHAKSMRVQQVPVSVSRFDTWCQRENLKSVDLVKIDVETHEPEVLNGFGRLLLSKRPTILIEVLTNDVAHRLNHIFKDMGYLYFDINENTGPILQKEIKKSSSFNYLICQESVAFSLSLI